KIVPVIPADEKFPRNFVFTTTGVHLNPHQINHFTTTVAVPPPATTDPLAAPALLGAGIDQVNVSGQVTTAVILTGQRLTVNNPGGPGSSFTDLKVDFIVNGKTYPGEVIPGKGQDLGNSVQQIAVVAPTSVPVGLAQIRVERPLNVLLPPAPNSTQLVPRVNYLPSNTLQLSASGNYLFAADGSGNVVVVNNQVVGNP